MDVVYRYLPIWYPGGLLLGFAFWCYVAIQFPDWPVAIVTGLMAVVCAAGAWLCRSIRLESYRGQSEMSANLDYPHVDYRARFFRQMDYGIALQRAIEHHCRGREVPADVSKGCPHHARLLNEHLVEIKRLQALLREARKGMPDGYKGQLSWRIDQEIARGNSRAS